VWQTSTRPGAGSDVEARVAALAGRILIGREGRLTADLAARELGWADCHALKRDLHRLNLPPFRTLQAQFTACRWMLLAERRGIGLARIALEEGRDPASAHRTVRRVSGMSWASLRSVSPRHAFPRLGWLLDLLAPKDGRVEGASAPRRLAG